MNGHSVTRRGRPSYRLTCAAASVRLGQRNHRGPDRSFRCFATRALGFRCVLHLCNQFLEARGGLSQLRYAELIRFGGPHFEEARDFLSEASLQGSKVIETRGDARPQPFTDFDNLPRLGNRIGIPA